MTGEYDRAFRESVSEPERFWGDAAAKVQWYRTCDRVLNCENLHIFAGLRGEY